MNRISVLRSNPFTSNHCFCFQLFDLCCSFWLWEFYVLNLVVWGCVGRSPHQLNQSRRKPKLRRRARRGRTQTSPSVLQLPFSSSCKAHSFSVLMFCGLRCFFGVNVACESIRDDFRKEYKEAHPDSKDVKAVSCFILSYSLVIVYKGSWNSKIILFDGI